MTHGEEYLRSALCKWVVFYPRCKSLRLSHAIHDVINTDQMGYIKGRSVSLLLRLIDNVIDQLNVSHKPSFLITVDNFHAFDRVSKHFVLKAFEKKKVLVEISLDGFPFY